jgi:short-subunit dehydrogenase
VIDVNVIGQMNVTCVALELLKNTYRSTIINMCSASSLYGNPDLTAYAASKSAVKSLTESWNMLFKKYGIHVADIIPSYVKTDMLKGKEDTIYAKDIKLSPAGIAQSVWNATCSKKVHHVIGADARLLSFAKRALPEFLLASILKRRFYKEALLKN